MWTHNVSEKDNTVEDSNSQPLHRKEGKIPFDRYSRKRFPKCLQIENTHSSSRNYLWLSKANGFLQSGSFFELLKGSFLQLFVKLQFFLWTCFSVQIWLVLCCLTAIASSHIKTCEMDWTIYKVNSTTKSTNNLKWFLGDGPRCS